MLPSLDQSLTSEQAIRQPPRYQPLILCLLATVVGILIDDRRSWDYRFYLVLIAASLVMWSWLFGVAFGGRFGKRDVSTPVPRRSLLRLRLASACLMVCLSTMAGLWHHVWWNWFPANDIGRYVGPAGLPVGLEGMVLKEPRWLIPNDSDDGMNYRQGIVRTRLELRATRLREGAQWIDVGGKLDLVIHARTTKFRSGDQVVVFGKLSLLKPPTNPGQFDFQAHSRSQRKLVTLQAYSEHAVTTIKPAEWSWLRPLSLMRSKFNETLWRYLGPDEAAFASAIMLGNREQLSAERRESFLTTGTSHLLAISGLHVGILAGSFFLLFRVGLLSRKGALLATIVFVLFYAWLVEFRPPALRAAILIVTFCVGKLLGRKGFSFNLLALAGLIVLLFNPRDLFNLGAQLSFLAVATLNFGSAWIFLPPPMDPLQRLIASTRSWPVRTVYWLGRQLRTAFLVSAIIWCISLPLVASHFKLVAPIALLINPLLLLPLAWALYSGLLLLIVGFLSSPLAYAVGKICEWNLNLVERTIRLAETVPGGHWATSGPTLTAVIVFYVGLFWLAVFPVTRLRFRWLAMLWVMWFGLAWWLPDQVAHWKRGHWNRPLVCTIIDVNHGSAILLQMPDGKNILYDAGSFGSSVYGYRSISSVLWSERIEHLDTVIISHADLDHYNALPELSRRFSIGEVLATKRSLTSSSPSVQALLARLRSLKVPLRAVDADTAKESEASPIHPHISIINPPRAGTGGNDNSDSLVLLVNSVGFRILLTGDLEGPGMERLLALDPLQCDLVMAPHHGSFNSDPSEFMAWADPRHVVISGETQRIRETAVEIFQLNQRNLFRTDFDGAIRCVVDAQEAKIQTWTGGNWRDNVHDLLECSVEECSVEFGKK